MRGGGSKPVGLTEWPKDIRRLQPTLQQNRPTPDRCIAARKGLAPISWRPAYRMALGGRARSGLIPRRRPALCGISPVASTGWISRADKAVRSGDVVLVCSGDICEVALVDAAALRICATAGCGWWRPCHEVRTVPVCDFRSGGACARLIDRNGAKFVSNYLEAAHRRSWG